jgi:hypothetical protein
MTLVCRSTTTPPSARCVESHSVARTTIGAYPADIPHKDDAGTLGGEILRHFRVVFEQRRRRLVLDRREPLAPEVFDLVGVEAVPELPVNPRAAAALHISPLPAPFGAALIVESVNVPSPAHDAGIAPNDELLAIFAALERPNLVDTCDLAAHQDQLPPLILVLVVAVRMRTRDLVDREHLQVPLGVIPVRERSEPAEPRALEHDVRAECAGATELEPEIADHNQALRWQAL